MFRLPLTRVQRDECEMNGRRQSTQELAHMIGTHSRQQKINADFLVAANAAMQKTARRRALCCGRERI
jgi:hypothetical protein